MVENGIYIEDCDGLSVEEIEERYGAGIEGDEDENEEPVQGEEHEAGDPINIDHDPVGVDEAMSPFIDEETEVTFFTALVELTELNYIPPELGVLPEEWEGGQYPSSELLKVGGRRHEQVVELPEEVWLPKAQLWARALDLMMRTQELEGLDL